MQSSVLQDSFIRDLKKDLDDYCRGLEKSLKLAYTYIPLKTDEEYSKVLRFRHFNEQRHAEMAAFWVRSTPEDDVKKSLSHQSWEEYEHGIWLEALMKKYGIDPWDYVPTPEQAATWNAIEGLRGTVERITATQLYLEGCARYFLKVTVESNKVRPDILKTYRRIIKEEQSYEAVEGERTLRRYANTPERQAEAWRTVKMLKPLVNGFFAGLDRWVFEGKHDPD